MKKILRKLFNKTGFDVIKTKNLHNDLSKHLLNVLVDKDIDCIIDVGANSGQYGEFLREFGYTGHIVSLEPVGAVFEKLKENCEQDDKWSCYQIALGDKNED